jgi:membrane protease YdiL (CAAX protease family)
MRPPAPRADPAAEAFGTVNNERRLDPEPIRAVALIHQEGVLAVIAVIGLSLGDNRGLLAFAPRGSAPLSVAVGCGAGLVCVGLLWLIRRLPPLERLERWQRAVVAKWSVGDAVAVAVMSGLAEEAMLRAFLQPIIGLVPAAILFAVLHLVPDRALWFWPFFALVSGLLLGGLFEVWGYPAAAAAHVVINVVALVRLGR